MRNRLLAALLSAAMLLSLSACAKAPSGDPPSASGSSSSSAASSQGDVSAMTPVDVSTPDPEPDPEPMGESASAYLHPLTGEGLDVDISQNRPVAVMVNNLKKALPQLGVSQADIIYEIPAEGGITRMMALFQDLEGVGKIGSVRSARDYYVSLAYGHDAIFLHAGGSDQAYITIKKLGVTALDCVNGPYEGTLFWRDKDRKVNMGFEHSVLTSGEKIQELLPTYKKVTLTHKDSYVEPLTFMAKSQKAQGSPAASVSVKFSNYKTGLFTYDSDTGLYAIEEYGKPYVDGNTGDQVSVKNVLVLHTDISPIKGDDKGRISVRTTGSGEGYFFCDGVAQTITWSRKDGSPMTYQGADGSPLKLGVGATYVNIVDTDAPVDFS